MIRMSRSCLTTSHELRTDTVLTMDRWKFYTVYGHWLWLIFFLLSIAAVAVTLFFGSGCGPGTTEAARLAKSARYVMQALCHDDITVRECGDILEEQAGFLSQADAGVR